MRQMKAALKETIFYRFARIKVVPEDNSNVFRSELFRLFPNLVEIELWTTHSGEAVKQKRFFPLNPVSLLTMLSESTIPSSFQFLKIRDRAQKWAKHAFG